MTRILLINPNASQTTTAMMVAIAQAAAPSGMEVIGATARHGPSMIVEETALAASVAEVMEMGARLGGTVSGIIVSAFGDPGVEALRRVVSVPVVGIAEAGMREAAAQDRRFGIATVTAGLAEAIGARAAALGLGPCYTGIRLTEGDPLALAADPAALVEALALAVTACIVEDHAEAVVIGGGPLGNAATALAPRFAVPVIAPIPAAMRLLLGAMSARGVEQE